MENKTKIFTGCVAIFIFCFLFRFLSNDIFSGDDFSNLASLTSGGGKYNIDGILTSGMSNFFGYWMPSFFHIHPHQFSMTFGAVLRSFSTVILFFVLSLFLYCGRSKTRFFPVAVFFSALYFCYAASNINFDRFNSIGLPQYDMEGSFVLITEYAQHFGQFIPFIFALAAIYLMISAFINNKLLEKKALLLCTVSTFIAAVSSMFACVTVGIFLGMICCFLCISDFKQNQNFLKNLSSPVSAYVLGALIFAFYPGFFSFFSLNINVYSLGKILYKTFILQNSLELALIIILSSVLYFLALNKTSFIKRTIFSVYTIICSMLVYFVLFSKLDTQMPLLLTESEVLVRFVLFSLILLLFSACQKELVNEVISLKILKSVICLIIIVFSVVQVPFICSTMKLWRTMSEETKVTIYCIEKMYRFYSLQGKTALLPEDSLMKIFQITHFLNDNNIDEKENISPDLFFKNTDFTSYYKKTYKNSEIVSYKFINSKKALKIFFESGGMIDENEIKHINFQNLYNDDFVLNRAIEKAKYGI